MAPDSSDFGAHYCYPSWRRPRSRSESPRRRDPGRIALEIASLTLSLMLCNLFRATIDGVLPAILLVPVFVVVNGCLHSLVQLNQRHLSLISLCFSSIAAGILGVDYFIQLQVVEPSLIRAETSSLSLFTQYNPHGLFIVLEDFGYLTLCFSFLFAGLAFPRIRRLARVIRWTFIVSALIGFACFIGMTWRYGLEIEYRFEVAIITITWIMLFATGLMLAFFFRSPVQAGTTTTGKSHSVVEAISMPSGQ
jgi:hypothetical protein